jgi:predicted transcriptional regulator
MNALLESPEIRDVPEADTEAKPLPVVVADKRPLTVEPPEQPITFDQWQTVISTNFPAYARPAEICASVVVQLLLNDVANPFALALVDVPSSGKTIILNFFDVPDLAYTTDNFTPASFVSHASNVKREDLAKVDMLPRIRYRTLIVRDLAPIFGVKEDELLKTMGILTRALDGEGLETDSGVHGKRGYKGDWLFMLLAGTTPIPPRVFKVMGTLGSRLFFLALHSNAKSHDELIAQNRGTARREKEQACREATNSLLRTLWAANPAGVEWNKDGDPEDCLHVIARCAELLAALRGAIQVWPSEHDTSMNHNVPVIEQPDRINCLLYNLARGHALLRGRTQLATADLAPVLEMTFDSAPTIRSKVFRGLLEQGGTMKTSHVEKLLRCSKPTALKEMEALAVLGVADKTEADAEYGRPEHELRLAEKFEWFATDERKAKCWQSKQAQGGNT